MDNIFPELCLVMEGDEVVWNSPRCWDLKPESAKRLIRMFRGNPIFMIVGDDEEYLDSLYEEVEREYEERRRIRREEMRRRRAGKRKG